MLEAAWAEPARLEVWLWSDFSVGTIVNRCVYEYVLRLLKHIEYNQQQHEMRLLG